MRISILALLAAFVSVTGWTSEPIADWLSAVQPAQVSCSTVNLELEKTSARFIAVKSMACETNKTLTKRAFLSAIGTHEIGLIRGIWVENKEATHSMVSLMELDRATMQPKVLGQAASPMRYNPAAGMYQMAADNRCTSPHMAAVRAFALERFTKLAGMPVVAEDLPLCLDARTSKGDGLMSLRGFKLDSSGVMISDYSALLRFDWETGQVTGIGAFIEKPYFSSPVGAP